MSRLWRALVVRVGCALVAVVPALLPLSAWAAETRVALVIANAQYATVAALKNPPADAALVADSLRRAGFTSVTTLENLDKASLDQALSAFSQAADDADVALIYYAGHGIEAGGQNYLIPVDARLARDRDLEVEATSLDTVLRMVDGARRLRIVVLDACRENPFAAAMQRDGQGRSIGRGLARIEPEGDTLVAYAARAGMIAADGDGANSPFAAAFANRVVEPGLEIGMLFRQVRDDVLSATSGEQNPVVYGELSRAAFYFIPVGGRPAPATIAATPATKPNTVATAAPRLTRSAFEQVRPGQTLAQVRALLGSGDQLVSSQAVGPSTVESRLWGRFDGPMVSGVFIDGVLQSKMQNALN